MSLDALCVNCVVKEISEKIIGGRIEKIYQPEKDEIVLNIRTFTDSFRLVLCASSNYPRLNFTTSQKQNPQNAPLFCMLLRKHLGSGKIVGIRQVDFERIVEIDIESYDELGDLSVKQLIVEIMGRHSNVILVSPEKRIIDSIKHIDFTVSSVRQVLPGLTYEYPPKQDKTPLLFADSDLKIDISQKGQSLDKAILDAVMGISPLTAREIIYNIFGTTDIKNEQIIDKKRVIDEIIKLKNSAKNGDFSPCILKDVQNGKLIDFSSIPIKQYEQAAEVICGNSINQIIDEFYKGRDSAERMKQKSADLVKLLNTHIERAAKKRIILLKTLKDAENKEKYKLYGELITANIYKIKDTDRELCAENYYEASLPVVKIPLDPSLSPSENAQKYFKKYQKARTAEIEVAKQIQENDTALEYLESTLVLVLNCETEADINAIRTELAEQGYLKRIAAKKNKRLANTSKPMHVISKDGFDIYIGRNNTQNDYLTLKFANSNDYWFHTKNIHGSHVIIKLGLDKNVPESTMLQAAQLAAYYSKGRDSSQVPVDYTLVKNVKKPNGAKPGMVIYDYYNTVYVTPENN